MKIPLLDKVPRDHLETDAAFHRRRRVVGGVSVAGAALLGVSLSTKPDSKAFYALTLGVAATWTGGALYSGPLHRGWEQVDDNQLRRETPITIWVALTLLAKSTSARGTCSPTTWW